MSEPPKPKRRPIDTTLVRLTCPNNSCGVHGKFCSGACERGYKATVGLKETAFWGKQLYRAANMLVKRMDFVHHDPRFVAVWAHAEQHEPYVGPRYEAELSSLKLFLAKLEPWLSDI